MMHLQHEIGSAAAGSKEAKSKFANLGLDPDKLAGEGFESALGEIADRFVSLKDPVQQATMAYELFGRRGESWIPILARGSAGLKEGAERAGLVGRSLTEIDAKNVQGAMRAIRTIEGTVQGVFQQVAIGISPYISAVGTWFEKITKEAGGVGPLVKSAFIQAAKAIALVIDELGELTNQFKDLKALTSKEGAAKGLFNFGVANPHERGIFSPRGWSEVTDPKKLALEREQRRKAKLGGGTGKAGDGFREWIADMESSAPKASPFGQFDEKAERLGERISGLNAELRKSVATVGLSSDAAKLWELRTDGATEAQLATTRSLINERDQLEALGKAYDKHGVMAGFRAKADVLRNSVDVGALREERAKIEAQLGSSNVIEATAGAALKGGALEKQIAQYRQLGKQLDNLTGSMNDLGAARDKALFERAAEIKVKLRPDLTQFKDSLEDLGTMFGKGLITGTEASLSALDSFTELEKKLGLGGEAKFASGAEAGSVEAQSIMNRFGAQDTSQDMAGRLQRLIQVAEDEGKRRQADADRLLDALRKTPVPKVGNF